MKYSLNLISLMYQNLPYGYHIVLYLTVKQLTGRETVTFKNTAISGPIYKTGWSVNINGFHTAFSTSRVRILTSAHMAS